MHDLQRDILDEFVEASRKVDYRAIRDPLLREDMRQLLGLQGGIRVGGKAPRHQTSKDPRQRALDWQREYERKKRWRRGLNVTRGAAARSVWYVVVAVCPGVENDNAEPLNEREAI